MIKVKINKCLSPYQIPWWKESHHQSPSPIQKLHEIHPELRHHNHHLLQVLVDGIELFWILICILLMCKSKCNLEIVMVHAHFHACICMIYLKMGPSLDPLGVTGIPIAVKSCLIAASRGICGLRATPAKILTKRLRIHASVLIESPGLWWQVYRSEAKA